MAGHLVDRKVGHLEGLMAGHLVDRKVGHLEGLKVDHLEDLKVQAVAVEGLLLFERLVLLEQVQVVQQVVREEAMEQAQIVPE